MVQSSGGSSLAVLVRTWRERALLTQEQLAGRAGLGVRTIRRLEAGGQRRPRGESVLLLADALGLTESERAQLFATVRGEPARPTPTSADVPRQLPADVAGFCGRAPHLDEMDALLAGDGAPTTMVISTIAGTAGVGKTALAVHWAHRVADQFPDGQLYVNLRGFDPGGTPTEPAAAIRGFLDALGVAPQRIPTGLDAQAAQYRSMLAGRRMLVVLDNARDTAQVRPLLPGAPTCLVLVTSRDQLTGLVAADGAHPIVLDLLSTAEARELLVCRLGPDRTAAEPDAVEDIITGCARLPLALAVVAARAALNPRLSLRVLAEDVRDTGVRLDALDAGDAVTSVRAVFSWSYQQLHEPAARMFRLLGLHPGPDISRPAAASLAAVSLDQARAALRELASAHLIAERTPGRYSFHDLLRTHAAELAHTHDNDNERRTAVRRLLDHYLQTAHRAAELLSSRLDRITLIRSEPGVSPERPGDQGQALAWFDAERPVLLGAIERAASTGFDAHAWQLAWTVHMAFALRVRWRDSIVAHRTALEAAWRLGDRHGQATICRCLGHAYSKLGRYDDAEAHFRQALALSEETGDQAGQANTHLALTIMCNLQRNPRKALAHAQQALALLQAAGHLSGQANGLHAVGWSHVLLGEYEQALVHCQQALILFQKLGDRFQQAGTLASLGYAYQHLGQYGQATCYHQRAVDLYREIGDSYHEAETLTHIGDTHRAAGNLQATRTAWRQALAILDDLDQPDADQVRTKLAALDTPTGSDPA